MPHINVTIPLDESQVLVQVLQQAAAPDADGKRLIANLQDRLATAEIQLTDEEAADAIERTFDTNPGAEGLIVERRANDQAESGDPR